MPESKPEICIVLPCLNEEEGILLCLQEIFDVARENHLNLSVIVVDNGSTDRTVQFVEEFISKNSMQNDSSPNIKIIKQNKRGYGNAYLAGFETAIQNPNLKYIFMSDADFTYDFKYLPQFIAELKRGADLVIGNRFAYFLNDRSMPFLHKYIGNPLLSYITRLVSGLKVQDIHSGMRAISKESLLKLNLKSPGMELATEMMVRAQKCNLKIVEVPIKYRPRIGESKLNTWSDGFRHLKYIIKTCLKK